MPDMKVVGKNGFASGFICSGFGAGIIELKRNKAKIWKIKIILLRLRLRFFMDVKMWDIDCTDLN